MSTCIGLSKPMKWEVYLVHSCVGRVLGKIQDIMSHVESHSDKMGWIWQGNPHHFIPLGKLIKSRFPWCSRLCTVIDWLTLRVKFANGTISILMITSCRDLGFINIRVAQVLNIDRSTGHHEIILRVE